MVIFLGLEVNIYLLIPSYYKFNIYSIFMEIVMSHIPVLLNQILQIFKEQLLITFVDGTLGAAGHSSAILQNHPEIEQFVGIDQDPIAREIAQKTLIPWGEKVKIIAANFSQLAEILNERGIKKVDGILLDLGVSSMQFDRDEKGFSFQRDGPLDMRMNPDQSLTAKEIVNEWPEKEIGRILREYGEEKRWKLIAKAIVKQRQVRPFETTKDLVNFLDPMLRKPSRKKEIHPLTLVFQALRIAVNQELEHLEKVLPQAFNHLEVGGILAIISFHSLEDRLVKHFMQKLASNKVNTSGLGGGLFLDKPQEALILTPKPLSADNQEIQANPRSRSAKLRAIRKI